VAGQLTEHESERVITMQAVVAKTQRQDGRNRLDPTDHQPDNIERGLVGVVQVLEHQNARRPTPQLTKQRPRDLVGPRVALHQHRQLAADLRRGLEQRTERTGGKQRVACPPQNREPPWKRGAELPQQRRLADPRLSGDQDDVPAPKLHNGFAALVQTRQRARPFEQPRRVGWAGSRGRVHGEMIAPIRRCGNRGAWQRICHVASL
jgi:hypothetical protein